jgi:hypothetical protein
LQKGYQFSTNCSTLFIQVYYIKPMSSNKLYFCLSIILNLLFPCAHGQEPVASAIQTGHYMPGYINIRDWSAMPQGLLILDYNAYYTCSQYYDNQGKEVKSISITGKNSINLDMDVSGFSTVPCVFWGSSFKILGGARYFAGAMIDYSTYSVSLALQQISNIMDTVSREGNVSGSAKGFGDLIVVPAGLSWELKRVDLTLWHTIYAPTGRYKTGGSDNMGMGFWTNQTQFSANIYPFFQGDEIRATDFMIAGSMEFNSKIKDVDVRPGSRFSLEYGISQYLSDRFEIGIIGGNNWQVGKDSGDKVWWDTSVKDKVSTVGGLIGYWPVKDRLYMTLMYSTNYGMVQTVKANVVQINLFFDTNLLKKHPK